ncbi:hypothetical protein [Algoriphagus persicinus]|uniref:hypothetical protein n=1 Tax=Algoriphagus persicinus TaxID=3108754 RepID=UPI002B3909AD|nr:MULTISPECIES: hypothetical protein [unclassified Algoriphagus]MEB2779111.1 hypothetical protein [Algoriphagus sp. C2-6-M1]MEB2783944.1 hypothetical protein [Algoriphagus sp. E1-3-M2]
MNRSTINKTLWLSGLLTGAVVGVYLYKNREEFGPQKEKLNSLLGDFQSIIGDLKTKLLEAKTDGLEATKSALKSAKDKVEKVK